MRKLTIFCTTLLVASCAAISFIQSAAAADAPEKSSSIKAPLVVFVTGDDEYRSEITMPMIAGILEKNYGMRTKVAYARPEAQSKHHIEGLEALRDADLAVVYIRFRALPDEELKEILDYANSGKPIVGLRTATHSFLYPKDDKNAKYNDGFGREVFGQQWIYHHGHRSSTDVTIIPSEKDNAILRGVDSKFHIASWLYHVKPLIGDCHPLLEGHSVNSERKDGNVSEPVAWTKTNKGGRVFFTTMGHPSDFENENVRRVLVNGILWGLGQDVPKDGANVTPAKPFVAPKTH